MKRVLLLLFISIVLILGIPLNVFAQNKTSRPIILAKNEVVNRDYLAASDSVRISGTVNGDVYIAGGNVTVDGIVNGDLIAGGGTIIITGFVKNDVRVAGGNVTFSGARIGGNVTALGGQIVMDKSTQIAGSLVGGGGTFTLLSPIGRGLTLGAGQATIGDTIGGDVNAGVGQITFSNNSKVNGNVTYWSENKAVFDEGATVSGAIKQEIPPQRSMEKVEPKRIAQSIAGALIAVKIADFVMLLIIGIILISLLPVFSASVVNSIKTNFWISILVGFIALIVTPVLSIILLMTVIGIPAGILLMIIFGVTLWLVRIFAIMALGKFAIVKIGKTSGNSWAYVLGLIIYFILGFIPIVSFITDTLVLLSGFGSFLMNINTSYSNLRTKNLI